MCIYIRYATGLAIKICGGHVAITMKFVKHLSMRGLAYADACLIGGQGSAQVSGSPRYYSSSFLCDANSRTS